MSAEEVAEVGAYARQKEATARARNDAARMAQIAAQRTRELASLPEQIAQAIEAGVLPSHPNSGYRDGFARAAQIARAYRSESTP